MNKLLDFLTRHQIYLEGYKQYTAFEFNKILRDLEKELKELFREFDFDSLSELTKTELYAFQSEVRKLQRRIYKPYLERILNDLYEFMQAETEVIDSIFKADPDSDNEESEEEEQEQNLTALWATIRNAIIPANGLTLQETIELSLAASASLVLNEVAKAYVNKTSNSEFFRRIVGNRQAAFQDGALRKIYNSNRNSLATVIQSITSLIQNTIGPLYYKKYIWNSVLDSRTTEICLSRNGNVYLFGKGPLPPAHINCRSSILPVNNSFDLVEVSYYSWLKAQPGTIQDDILGPSRAEALRKGKLKADDFQKFVSEKPLSLDEYKSKRGKMTQ